MGMSLGTLFFVGPVFTGSRILPFRLSIPGVDTTASPIFEIILVIEVSLKKKLEFVNFTFSQFLLMFPTNTMYSGVTCFFISSSLCGIIQVKVLQHQMETVTDGLKSNKEIDARLDTLIKSHSKIGQYVKDLDDLLAYTCLVEFLTFGLNILSLLFAITTVI